MAQGRNKSITTVSGSPRERIPWRAVALGAAGAIAVSFAAQAQEFGVFQESCAQAMQQDDYTINKHACETIRDIGPAPDFGCHQGALIPITHTTPQTPDGVIAQHASNQMCDRPPLLPLGGIDGQCVPYARVGRLEGKDKLGAPDPDVEWAFICRRYKLRSDPQAEHFEDVALIGYRRSTGKTSFFQALLGYQPHYLAQGGIPAGNRVTPPHELESQTPAGGEPASRFWLSPQRTAGINCPMCHDSDPWIHTPYIDQVCSKDATGQCEIDTDGMPVPIVPRGPDLANVSAASIKYSFVGDLFRQQWDNPRRGYLLPPGNECTRCHVIGTQRSADYFTPVLTGNLTGANLAAFISDQFRTYPHSHWMAPHQAALMPQTRWNQLYRASVDQIVRCRLQPSAAECGFRSYYEP